MGKEAAKAAKILLHFILLQICTFRKKTIFFEWFVVNEYIGNVDIYDFK